jgi:hypothetical protein
MISRKRLTLALIVPVLGIAAGMADMVAAPSAPDRKLVIPPASILADGDLVFRRGRDLTSRAVLAHSERSHFSHVGMLIHTKSGWQVIHAIPAQGDQQGGVLAESLERFLAETQAVAAGVYRIDSLDKAMARQYLLDHLGRHFDSSFRYSNDSDFYCTELVLKAIGNGGIDLVPELTWKNIMALAEPVLLPDDLLGSPRLREIWRQP